MNFGGLGFANSKLGQIAPGFALAVLIAVASLFIEGRFGGPVMLYALAIGVCFNTLSRNANMSSGLKFSANTVLKIGVALLGVKITIVDVADLGLETASLVVIGVAATLIVGTAIGRLLGLSKPDAILSSGAVGICGSSAALAIASVLPPSPQKECSTIVTVIVVTALSTLAMVLYPLLATLLHFTDTQAGIFMGVTIHNVAQVVGAGYMISDPAGDIATIVKLMRVACLLPVIMIISLIFRKELAQSNSEQSAKKPPLLPLFLVGFLAIMLINSLGLIPESAGTGLSHISRLALVTAVAALGVKISLKDLVGVGFKPILVLSLQTLFLALLAMCVLSFILTA